MRFWALVALAAMSGAALAPTNVDAAAKGKGKKPPAGTLEKKISIAPDGIRWGMTLEHLAKVYDQYFDAMFLNRYKKVDPGIRMERLDAEVKEKKDMLRRSRIDFGDTPTGVDNTALNGEYSYGNGESMAHVTINGDVRRNFFFFSDRLWKIYDEYPLRNGSELGLTFEDAVGRLTARFGAEPERLEQDHANGRPFEVAQWTGPTMIIRAINREPILGLVFIDKSVENDLSSRRKSRMRNPQAIDRDVSSIVRDKNPPGPTKDDKKKKK